MSVWFLMFAKVILYFSSHFTSTIVVVIDILFLCDQTKIPSSRSPHQPALGLDLFGVQRVCATLMNAVSGLERRPASTMY